MKAAAFLAVICVATGIIAKPLTELAGDEFAAAVAAKYGFELEDVPDLDEALEKRDQRYCYQSGTKFGDNTAHAIDRAGYWCSTQGMDLTAQANSRPVATTGRTLRISTSTIRSRIIGTGTWS